MCEGTCVTCTLRSAAEESSAGRLGCQSTACTAPPCVPPVAQCQPLLLEALLLAAWPSPLLPATRQRVNELMR